MALKNCNVRARVMVKVLGVILSLLKWGGTKCRLLHKIPQNADKLSRVYVYFVKMYQYYILNGYLQVTREERCGQDCAKWCRFDDQPPFSCAMTGN